MNHEPDGYPAEPLVSITNLSNAYRNRQILHNVNLDIMPGEFFGLVGESGSGKTTLARALLGLIAYDGEIRIGGLLQRGQHQRRDRAFRRCMARNVQAVFQDPGGSLDPLRTVGAILEEPLCIHRLGTKTERAAQVDETLRLVGLDPSCKNRRPGEFSGGQQQRIGIAAALMLRPRLLIADEATSALDVSMGAHILNLFQTLGEELGLTLLFISHDQNAVAYLCSRYLTLNPLKVSDT